MDNIMFSIILNTYHPIQNMSHLKKRKVSYQIIVRFHAYSEFGLLLQTAGLSLPPRPPLFWPILPYNLQTVFEKAPFFFLYPGFLLRYIPLLGQQIRCAVSVLYLCPGHHLQLLLNQAIMLSYTLPIKSPHL